MKGFRNEFSAEELERVLRANFDERAKVAEELGWTLENWLYWMDQETRPWRWCGHSMKGANILVVWLEIDGWPAPLSAIEYLFRLSGASRIEHKH